MINPKLPENEIARLEVVKSYNILDTLPDADYDNITNLIATICNMPVALIGFLDEDRNYFKSHYGVPFNESPREISFCGHTILGEEIMIVEDARLDERFIGNPLLTEHNAIFYAGVPLVSPEGYSLGTICVFDQKPRRLVKQQIKALKTLGKQVVNLLELRKKNQSLELAKKELQLRNQQLKTFANHVSHDLKSPLTNIMSLTTMVKQEIDDNLSDDAKMYLNAIDESATILKEYIDGMLLHYRSDDLINAEKATVDLEKIGQNIEQILISNTDELKYPKIKIKHINKPVITQILINLVDNALKYNDKAKRIVKIGYESIKDYHRFSVSDNGIGIPQPQQERIFELFEKVHNDLSQSSTGIGLSTVRNLVEKLNGKISVSSIENEGSTFTFTIKK
ncbi:MAG: GAF domain-containing sensor histidine kinase [Winogradskyella sp.]|uniref:sensor histidine kinase n=1 Tax=Winogradskyella sp. TaxID=1883156 RepID=UPI0017CF451E|nr:GAF domain-containing sensor histidine kinase [Winogradskyella sp.]